MGEFETCSHGGHSSVNRIVAQNKNRLSVFGLLFDKPKT